MNENQKKMQTTMTNGEMKHDSNLLHRNKYMMAKNENVFLPVGKGVGYKKDIHVNRSNHSNNVNPKYANYGNKNYNNGLSSQMANPMKFCREPNKTMNIIDNNNHVNVDIHSSSNNNNSNEVSSFHTSKNAHLTKGTDNPYKKKMYHTKSNDSGMFQNLKKSINKETNHPRGDIGIGEVGGNMNKESNITNTNNFSNNYRQNRIGYNSNKGIVTHNSSGSTTHYSLGLFIENPKNTFVFDIEDLKQLFSHYKGAKHIRILNNRAAAQVNFYDQNMIQQIKKDINGLTIDNVGTIRCIVLNDGKKIEQFLPFSSNDPTPTPNTNNNIISTETAIQMLKQIEVLLDESQENRKERGTESETPDGTGEDGEDMIEGEKVENMLEEKEQEEEYDEEEQEHEYVKEGKEKTSIVAMKDEHAFFEDDNTRVKRGNLMYTDINRSMNASYGQMRQTDNGENIDMNSSFHIRNDVEGIERISEPHGNFNSANRGNISSKCNEMNNFNFSNINVNLSQNRKEAIEVYDKNDVNEKKETSEANEMHENALASKRLSRFELIDIFGYPTEFDVLTKIQGFNNANIKYIYDQTNNKLKFEIKGRADNNAPVVDRMHIAITADDSSVYQKGIDLILKLLNSLFQEYCDFCMKKGVPLPPALGFKRHEYIYNYDGSTKYIGIKEKGHITKGYYNTYSPPIKNEGVSKNDNSDKTFIGNNTINDMPLTQPETVGSNASRNI